MPLQPKYENSHALVVGVNKYQTAGPLSFARNDAEAVAEVLRTKFGFPDENVRLLLDAEATKANVLSGFLRFASDPAITEDDRIVVFFAGHGHTVSGRSGETGFLVPVDGDTGDLGTLIRWDELTRGSDLIPAKHILFVMDACYGGLAFKRKPLSPGSMRYLRDMMMRVSRQVLTAGKADEPVSDGGGTRKGHSIFTSSLLDALEGAAQTQDGIISANGVMAYVYDQVGKSPHSQQTPHYGFVDGDGDLIFTEHLLKAQDDQGSGTKETDLLIKLAPPTIPSAEGPQTLSDLVKALLSDPAQRIRLDDLTTVHTRRAIDRMSAQHFPVSFPYTDEEFISRVGRYEADISDLVEIVVLLAKWGGPEQLPQLERLFSRLYEAERPTGGLNIWIEMQWYPVFVLMYAAGISALSARNYQALAIALQTPVRDGPGRFEGSSRPLVQAVVRHLTDIVGLFNKLPGLDRRYTARSDHLLKTLQPTLEDLLFLGRTYEDLFDAFEVLLALAHADIQSPSDGSGWGPPGRFAWMRDRGNGGPHGTLVEEAKKAGDAWGPLRSGLFQGKIKRLLEVSEGYGRQVSQIGWR